VEFSYNWVNLVQVSSVQLADFQSEHFHWKDVFITGVQFSLSNVNTAFCGCFIAERSIYIIIITIIILFAQ